MGAKFSIITINYNNSQGLLETIKSVVEQNYDDLEYIIVDGGSADSSLDVIEEYRHKIDIVISEKDEGIYDAMNKGIAQSTGDFLIFMNSGDTFFNSEVVTLFASNVDAQNDILYGDAVGRLNNSEVIVLKQPEYLDVAFWLFNSINHQASAIRKSVFDRFGKYSTKNNQITADWQFFIMLFLKHNVRFKYINENLAYYDLSGISSDINLSIKHRQEKESFIYYKLTEYWPTYQLLHDRKQKRSNQFFYIRSFPNAFRVLKFFMSVILLFLPKEKKK